MAITGHSPPLDKGFQVHRLDRPFEHKGCHGIWDLGSSPINVSRVLSYLQEYPNHDVVIELGEGFKNGFRLNYTGPRIFRESPNLLSANEHHEELKLKIGKEVELGRIAGPFKTLPISNLQISPIGLVPKSNGGWRLITHLSYPNAGGINQFIDPEHCTVKYTSFDRVVEMLSQIGRGAKMGVLDIKNAFRLLRVHPGDFDLLGFKFDNEFYIDKCLPMGCARSCRIFESFSSFIHWLVEQKTGLKTLDHYLDDFFFAGQEHSGNCEKLMGVFSDICKELGVPLAEDKSIGPVTVLTFLGLEINTEEMLIKIPQNKLDALVETLENISRRNRIALRDLQSLVGSLNFFGKAIRSSRAFNRRFYDLTVRANKPHHFIKLNNEAKADIRMWLLFLRSYNGKTFFPESVWTSNEVLELFTDSCMGIGSGSYFSGDWIYFGWPEFWLNSQLLGNITFLEFVPVVLALLVWGSQLRNKKIVLNIDNMALVQILNSQTSKSKPVMALMRPFVLSAMQNNIIFRARHIAGKTNEIADSISRQQWGRFRRLAPDAKEKPREVPAEFLQIISDVKLIDY